MKKQLSRVVGIGLLLAFPCLAQIDPSIALRFNPTPQAAPPLNILDAYRKIQEIKLQRQQIEMQQQQIDQARQDVAERRRVIPTPPKADSTIPDNFYSGGLINGRFWNAASQINRVAFLVGYSERVLVAEALGQAEPDWGGFPALPVTFGEIDKGVTRIYDSPENLNLPVIFAVGVFRKLVAGSTEQEISEQLQLGRKAFAAPQLTTPVSRYPVAPAPPPPVVHVPEN